MAAVETPSECGWDDFLPSPDARVATPSRAFASQVNVLGNDNFIVANTAETLLLGDMTSGRCSEVSWRCES